MELYRCLPAILLCLLVDVTTSQDSCAVVEVSVVGTIADQPQSETCTPDATAGEWLCQTLQMALDFLQSSEAPIQAIDCPPVKLMLPALGLPSYYHRITRPTDLGARSVRFLGQQGEGSAAQGPGGTRVGVTCDYISPSPSSSGVLSVNSTLSFKGAQMVSFEGVQVEDCPLPFRFEAVFSVRIEDSYFSHFTEAVFDLFNCVDILISRSAFEHNTGTGIVAQSYRGNTGSVSIGFNNNPLLPPSSNPLVAVKNCTFRNNSATAATRFQPTNSAFFHQVFTGRGGGMGVFMNEDMGNISVHVEGCVFRDNYAKAFGGGLYLLFDGDATQHYVSVSNSTFLSNLGELGGGGILMSWLVNGLPDHPHTVDLTDVVFVGNVGSAGGGLYAIPFFGGGMGNLLRMVRCQFSGNAGVGSVQDFGAAAAISSVPEFADRSFLPRYKVIDCVFSYNNGPNGILSIGYTPYRLSGDNKFVGNTGTPLRIIGTIVEFTDIISFINNSVPVDGGAVHFLSLGQAQLFKGLHMNFIGNNGTFGSSILADSITFPQTSEFNRLLFNPFCFFLFEEPFVPPQQWSNVSATFSRNRATLGAVLYTHTLELCSWKGLSEPYFNISSTLSWPFMDIQPDNVNTGYQDPHNPIHNIMTTATRLDIETQSVSAWPGQSVPISLTGYDQLERPTVVNVRFFPQVEANNSSPARQHRLVPQVAVVKPAIEELELSYGVYSGSGLEGNRTVLVESPYEGESIIPDAFSLEPLVCPAGFSLTSTSSGSGSSSGGRPFLTCSCDSSVEQILHCENDQDTLIIQHGSWAVYQPILGEGPNIHFYPCPPGYCRCSQNTSLGIDRCAYTFTTSNPDLQCVCSREGELCGQCKDGRGVSALLNTCKSCSDAASLLIVALLVLDAVLFAVIFRLDQSVPDWMCSFIFYFQVAPLVAEQFPDSFDGSVLHYIGSALSFYFVYDFCLYSNMSPVVSYFLRFLPLFVAILLCFVIAVVTHYLYIYYLRNIKLHTEPKAWVCALLKPPKLYGATMVFLLLYTHVVHTSLSVLNCPRLYDSSGRLAYRWYVDGSVECFTGGHTAVALLAIAVLVFAVVLIPLSAILPTRSLDKFLPRSLKRLEAPLAAPFSHNRQWWMAVELERRLLVLLMLTAFPRNPVYLLLVLLVNLTVYGFAEPFKSRYVNMLEVFVQANFVVMLITWESLKDTLSVIPSASSTVQEETNVTCTDGVSGFSILSWVLMPLYFLPLALFLIMLIYHLTVYMMSTLKCKKSRRRSQPIALNSSELTMSFLEAKTTCEVEVDHDDTALLMVPSINIAH